MKQKFATTLDLTTSFVGDAATALINKMFFGAQTIANGSITIVDDVNKAHHIRRLAAEGIITDVTCDFEPVGTVTIDERIITPAALSVNLQLCKANFKHVDWSSVRMGTGAGRTMAQDVIDSMVEEILGHIGSEVEHTIWAGDTLGTYARFDGFIKIMTADVPVGNQTTPSAVVAADVVEKLGAMYEVAAAQPWFDAPRLAYWVGPQVMAAYKQAMAAQGYMDKYQDGDKPENYLGIPMFVSGGIPASTMVLSHGDNLFFGTESVSNLNEVTLKDMYDVDLSDNFRFRSYAVGGVEIGWPEEVVLHLPA